MIQSSIIFYLGFHPVPSFLFGRWTLWRWLLCKLFYLWVMTFCNNFLIIIVWKFILWGGVCLFLNKYIFGYGTVAKQTRCTFCDFRVKGLATKSGKWQFGFVLGLMKEKRNVFSSFFVLKTDKGQVKMPIDEKALKILSKVVVIFCLCFLRAVF